MTKNCHAELVSASNNRESLPKCHCEERSDEAIQEIKFSIDKMNTKTELLTFGLPRFARNDKRAAFTLAEVLITLAIIGVVAAMTIPTLIANYEKRITEVRFQKAYSEIIQAVRLAEAEHGPMNTWSFGGAADDDMLASTKYFFENYLRLKINKSCYPVSEECWATTYSLDNLPCYKSDINYGGYSAVMVNSGYTIFSQIGKGGHNIVVDINGKNKH